MVWANLCPAFSWQRCLGSRFFGRRTCALAFLFCCLLCRPLRSPVCSPVVCLRGLPRAEQSRRGYQKRRASWLGSRATPTTTDLSDGRGSRGNAKARIDQELSFACRAMGGQRHHVKRSFWLAAHGGSIRQGRSGKSHEATHRRWVVFKIRSPGRKSTGGIAGLIRCSVLG